MIPLLLMGCGGQGAVAPQDKSYARIVMDRPCGPAYTAALMAIPDAGYEVTMMDRVKGLIVGEQHEDAGRVVGIRVSALRQSVGCLLTVEIVSPPSLESVTPMDWRAELYVESVRAMTAGSGGT